VAIVLDRIYPDIQIAVVLISFFVMVFEKALNNKLGLHYSVVADLKQIPNEHLTFKQDPKHLRRTEDGIIAYTWRHFLDDPSKPEWLLRMPMTKASVRAMDAVTHFVNKTIGNMVNNYCVGGASKVSV